MHIDQMKNGSPDPERPFDVIKRLTLFITQSALGQGGFDDCDERVEAARSVQTLQFSGDPADGGVWRAAFVHQPAAQYHHLFGVGLAGAKGASACYNHRITLILSGQVVQLYEAEPNGRDGKVGFVDAFDGVLVCTALEAKTACGQSDIVGHVHRVAGHIGCISGANDNEVEGCGGADNGDDDGHTVYSELISTVGYAGKNDQKMTIPRKNSDGLASCVPCHAPIAA